MGAWDEFCHQIHQNFNVFAYKIVTINIIMGALATTAHKVASPTSLLN